MAIPKSVKIKKGSLPSVPGVYKMKNADGEIIYIGKASSLKTRVSSYWNKAHDRKTEELVRRIVRVDYEVTDSVLEALILEAHLIKKYKPHYNIMQRDDRSWTYVCITAEDFPQIMLRRGHELGGELKKRGAKKLYKKIYGPFLSGYSVKVALELLRKIFPWSKCRPDQKRPCFDYHIGKCAGLCVGKVSKAEYQRITRHVMLMLSGKKKQLLKLLEKDMKSAAKKQDFERAALLRNKIGALTHINDVALLKKEKSKERVGLLGQRVQYVFNRIEGYDISNISGTSATGSMVVFEHGEPNKSEYRKFKIKTVEGSNDYASLAEVIRRRFRNRWPHPDVIMVDGGKGQVSTVVKMLKNLKVDIPVVGIAKGSARRRNDIILGSKDKKLAEAANYYKEELVAVRDEAHRFALKYHKYLRKNR